MFTSASHRAKNSPFSDRRSFLPFRSSHHLYNTPTMASLARFSRALNPAARIRLSPSWAARRTFATPTNNGAANQASKGIAAEALAQKTGHAPTLATAPKGKNKPSKIGKTPTSNAVKVLYGLLGTTALGFTYYVGMLSAALLASVFS